jgi:hypothetical protein
MAPGSGLALLSCRSTADPYGKKLHQALAAGTVPEDHTPGGQRSSHGLGNRGCDPHESLCSAAA